MLFIFAIRMQLPIAIGKNSNNTIEAFDLCTLPHLFVSYSHAAQLPHFLQACINNLNEAHARGVTVSVALALSPSHSSLAQTIECPIALQLHVSDSEQQENMGKDAFIDYLFDYMKQQLKKLKAGQKKPLLQLPLPYLVVIVDELFNLVVTRKKNTSIHFLQLLALGQSVNIHFIAASSSTYRNLLMQLIHLHPSVEKHLIKAKLKGTTQIVKPLGAELVLNADNLVFFRTTQMPGYERWYPL